MQRLLSSYLARGATAGASRTLACLLLPLLPLGAAQAQSADPAAGVPRGTQSSATAPTAGATAGPGASVQRAHPDDPAPGGPTLQRFSPPTSELTGDVDAIDFVPGSGLCGANQGQTIGWQFDVVNSVTVTGMSWFDDGQNGLDIAHEVAIWAPNGTMIPATNVTIPAGTGATLDGIWRVVKIPPTTLPVGQGYIVGGYNGSHSECLSFDVTQNVIADLNYIDATFSALGAALDRPTNFSGAVNGFYGVSFQVGQAGGGDKKNGVDFVPGSGSCGVNQGQTIGWQFDVVQPITVTSMTWFDDGQNGLDISHEVALWGPGGAMIAGTNVTIPAGTGATLDGIWRVVPIPPTNLPVGQGYIVGGYNGSHTECLSFNVTQTPHPNINYIDATFSALGPVLERPANFSGAVNGFYGVGFQIDTDEFATRYCQSLPNSCGAPALIDAVDLGATFELQASPVPGQPGIFFHAANQVRVAFGNGFLCAASNIVRLLPPVIPPACGTALRIENKAAYGAGTRHFQYWFRDPAAGGAFFNTSDAISITFP